MSVLRFSADSDVVSGTVSGPTGALSRRYTERRTRLSRHSLRKDLSLC
jgi:hypothetical protein